jgi:hypothetical protein
MMQQKRLELIPHLPTEEYYSTSMEQVYYYNSERPYQRLQAGNAKQEAKIIK